MNKGKILFIVFSFFALWRSSYANANKELNTCKTPLVYEQITTMLQAHRFQQADFFIINKVINTSPFTASEWNDFFKLAFDLELFCQPWRLHLSEIMQGIALGQFTEVLTVKAEKGDATARKFADYYPSTFPRDIYFKDEKKMDFSGNFYYYLHPETHRLYIKPNRQNKTGPRYLHRGDLLRTKGEGNTSSWNLFDRQGGPNQTIKEFAVAADLVVVLSRQNRFYFYKTTAALPVKWQNTEGFPKSKLIAPYAMDRWSFNVSLGHRPQFRRSQFMHPHDVVSYYEDADGKAIELGFCATIITLQNDKRTFTYWDTGLPTNWGRFLFSPLRSDVIVKNFSSAASTLFVMGYDKEKHLRFFTRMFDYDIYGGNPTLQNYFDTQNTPHPPLKYKDEEKKILDMHLANRKFPLPGWKEQPAIPRHLGSILQRVTILSTGEGPHARELRVEGVDLDRNYGYFFKNIDDESPAAWKFHPIIDPILTPAKYAETFRSLPAHKKYYDTLHGPIPFESDYLKDYRANQKDISYNNGPAMAGVKAIEILNYHYFLTADEASPLRIFLNNGDYFDLEWRTIDAWTPASQKKYYEYLIGDDQGEDKIILGTITTPPSFSPAQLSPMARETYETYFKAYTNNLTNAFHVRASNSKLYIEFSGSYRRSILQDDYIFLPPLTINMKVHPRQLKAGFFTTLIDHPRYVFSEQDLSPGKINFLLIEEKINANEELLAFLEEAWYQFRFQSLRHLFVNGSLLAIYSPLDQIFDLVNLQEKWPFLGSISKIAPGTLFNYTEMNFYEAFEPSVPKAAGLIVKRRLRHLHNLQEKTSASIYKHILQDPLLFPPAQKNGKKS